MGYWDVASLEAGLDGFSESWTGTQPKSNEECGRAWLGLQAWLEQGPGSGSNVI